MSILRTSWARFNLMKVGFKFRLGWLAPLLLGQLTWPLWGQINSTIGLLPADKSVTICFEVVITTPLGASVTAISAQGQASATGISDVLTDDPETAVFGDATLTALFQAFDFGDAPGPDFPTVLAQDGARHFIPATGAMLYLGTVAPDSEEDGQPDLTAMGDDSNSADDEDGLNWTSVLASNQSVSLSVRSSGSGFLNAWIDFNQDGDWADPGEQIFTNQAVVAGLNLLSFSTPLLNVGGPVFARFRLSSDQNLLPTGQASDGEVEDYRVILNSRPSAVSDTLERYPTQGVKVLASTLISNDTDADGDALTLVSISDATPAGAILQRAGDWIFYMPPSDSRSAGSFTYQVEDIHGDYAIGTVHITIKSHNEESQNKLSIVRQDGGFRLSFNGIPGRVYTIQYTDSLNPPNTVWSTLGQATANALGIYTLEDHPAPSTRYYRSVYP